MKNHGFTYLELIFIVLIIAILATIGIAKYGSNQDKALKATLVTSLSDLRQAIQLYKLKNNAFPEISALSNQFVEGHSPGNPINKKYSICTATLAEATARTIPDGCSDAGWAYYKDATNATIYATCAYQFSDGSSANNL
jgi:type II secretory pathway pseudopilin PulG